MATKKLESFLYANNNVWSLVDQILGPKVLLFPFIFVNIEFDMIKSLFKIQYNV